MKCDRLRDLASSALDGALDARRTEVYFDHLRACPPCLAFHEELRRSLALLAELPVVDASEGFEDRVWSRLAEEGFTGSQPARSPGFAGRVREWAAASFASSTGWERWSFASVAAAVFALALVSPDPAPRPAKVASSVSAPSPGAEVAELFTPSVPGSGAGAAAPRVGLVAEEDEFVAEMPEAVREYLRHAKDLRLPVGEDGYRRSNYSYPVRRVVDPSPFQLTGESAAPSSLPGAGDDAAVISF